MAIGIPAAIAATSPRSRRQARRRRTTVFALLVPALLATLAPSSARGDTAQAPAGPPAVITFLNQAIAWYRQQLAQAQLATDPSDVVYVDASRRQAQQIIQLAFTFARADAALEPQSSSEQPRSGTKERAAPDGKGKLSGSSLEIMASEASDEVARAQATVERLAQRVTTAAGRNRTILSSQLAEARSELKLAQARQQTLSSFLDFVRQVGSAGAAPGLLGQIDELEQSVPEAATPVASAAPQPPRTASAAATVQRAAPTGIMALASDLLALGRKMSELRTAIKLTESLRSVAEKVRAPLAADLRSTLQAGDQLSNAADTRDPTVLAQRTRDIDRLTSHFRAVSAALVPLGKIRVLLNAHKATLDEWHATADDHYDTDFRALALHLGLLAIAIGAILAASAFWRRATLRYVRDVRRRQQSLLVRRIVVAVAIALMIMFAFVTELGSLATFAGFITAGLAVALQNVILSVAAYFFLIGKFGIRVGDRVQISGVTGDVLDIGLVRLHLMELRTDGLPTGRVVVFSNSVLFQPAANFFKQMPGSNFAWHQVVLTVSPDTDYRYAEKRLMNAVEDVYGQYRDLIARQHERMSENMSITVREPHPHSQLKLTETGLEMAIRFPVPLDSAAAVDDEVTRALLDAVAREPRLKLVGSGTPTIQAVPEPAESA